MELEFPGAHGDHIAPGTAAQHSAHPHGAGLAAARLFDPIQNRKPEMDRQAHALDLLQIRHQRIAAFRRDIDIDLIQRRLTEPVHEGIVIGLDRDTLDLAPLHPRPRPSSTAMPVAASTSPFGGLG